MSRPCRTCKKPLREPLGPLGPFCSERCRLLDLGAWASGSYRLPGEGVSDGIEDEEDGGERRTAETKKNLQ